MRPASSTSPSLMHWAHACDVFREARPFEPNTTATCRMGLSYTTIPSREAVIVSMKPTVAYQSPRLAWDNNRNENNYQILECFQDTYSVAISSSLSSTPVVTFASCEGLRWNDGRAFRGFPPQSIKKRSKTWNKKWAQLTMMNKRILHVP
jgi:hypothetical protein